MLNEQAGGKPLTVVSLNIEGSKHIDRVTRFLLERKPDVVCLQEVPEYALMTIAKIVEPWHGGLGFAPMLQKRGLDGKAYKEGLVILSRLHPLYKMRFFSYVKQIGDELPFYADHDPNSYNRAFAWMAFFYEGREYCIGNFHHTWTDNGESTPEQISDTKVLLGYLEVFPHLVICGDSNAPRGGRAHDLFLHRYKDNIPSEIKSTLDPVLHRAAEKKLECAVDVLFTTPHYDVFDVEVVSGVSDHCAIVAKVLRREEG